MDAVTCLITVAVACGGSNMYLPQRRDGARSHKFSKDWPVVPRGLSFLATPLVGGLRHAVKKPDTNSAIYDCLVYVCVKP